MLGTSHLNMPPNPISLAPCLLLALNHESKDASKRLASLQKLVVTLCMRVCICVCVRVRAGGWVGWGGRGGVDDCKKPDCLRPLWQKLTLLKCILTGLCWEWRLLALGVMYGVQEDCRDDGPQGKQELNFCHTWLQISEHRRQWSCL